MKLYVGNLNYQMTEQELSDLFAEHGQVNEAVIVNDRQTGRPRGFGFVTMADDAAGQAAIAALNGTEVGGRTLTVNEARPKPDRGSRGRGGFGGGRRDRW